MNLPDLKRLNDGQLRYQADTANQHMHDLQSWEVSPEVYQDAKNHVLNINMAMVERGMTYYWDF